VITQLKKGVLELCVLAALKTEERYGYELITVLSERIQVTAGTIYPLLRRIKSEGLVETRTVDSPDGPSRKYYRLTAAGRDALIAEVAAWTDFYPRVNAMIGVDR
jgi:PadR family transcriptional regulator PadR